MKSHRIALSIFILLFATAALASDAGAALEKLKTLQGSWSGKSSAGRAVQTSYRVTSGGSALISEIHSDEDMISVFHMDGDRLLMTHYCGAGNQPRMAGTLSADGKSVSFTFLDATNLLPSQPGHMEHHVVTLVDANHYVEEWDFATNDGSKMHERFDMQRSK